MSRKESCASIQEWSPPVLIDVSSAIKRDEIGHVPEAYVRRLKRQTTLTPKILLRSPGRMSLLTAFTDRRIGIPGRWETRSRLGLNHKAELALANLGEAGYGHQQQPNRRRLVDDAHKRSEALRPVMDSM